MRTPAPSDRPWWLSPASLAVGISVLLHLGLLSAVVLVPEQTLERRSFGVDACRFDSEPTYVDWSEQSEPVESAAERSDVFRFADSEPEPTPAPTPSEPLALPGTGTEARPGGGGSPGEGESGGNGSGPGSGPAGPNLFPAASRARSVVFAIDCSLSMGLHGALETAKREVLAGLELLPPAARFQVIFYNREAHPLTVAGRRELLPANAFVRREVAALVAPVRAGGSTDHLGAVRLALSLSPEVIYLVTDADDLTPARVREVTQLNRGRAVLHTIDLAAGRPKSDRALRDLAARNRGTYRAVSVGAVQE